MVLLEFDPSVERYEEQPVCIEYTDAAGQQHSYTPDVLVCHCSNILLPRPPTLYEVKYREELFTRWKEIKPKVRAGRAYARERGWHFKLITEREIRTPYLQNAKFLRPYRDIDAEDEGVRLILNALSGAGESTPDQLLADIHKEPFKRAELLPTLWHLVSLGHIAADLNQPLTMCSQMWKPSRTEGDTPRCPTF